MSFDDFLNHRCNIYHPVKKDVDFGYGIKSEPAEERLKMPDLEDVPCHFYVSPSPKIVQKEPYPVVEGEAKLALPYGVDIRENDFVKSRGLIYRAGIPKAVHGNHHIVVTIKREEGIKGAI